MKKICCRTDNGLLLYILWIIELFVQILLLLVPFQYYSSSSFDILVLSVLLFDEKSLLPEVWSSASSILRNMMTNFQVHQNNYCSYTKIYSASLLKFSNSVSLVWQSSIHIVEDFSWLLLFCLFLVKFNK